MAVVYVPVKWHFELECAQSFKLISELLVVSCEHLADVMVLTDIAKFYKNHLLYFCSIEITFSTSVGPGIA